MQRDASGVQSNGREHTAATPARVALAHQAFSRAAGAPLVAGNSIRLLRDARENYPAWLDAIRAARRHVHFENYIIHDDSAGRTFADALLDKAREGVRVRLLYDWLGCFGKAPRAFWRRLRAGGVEVRCYNPPRWDSPVGWLSRDHRKTISVDGTVSFVSGLCIGQVWVGVPERGIEPWRDTGVEVRGPSVADIERAFADVWAMTGDPVAGQEPVEHTAVEQGDAALRVVATAPATAGLFRLGQIVAALARERLWLTDAYFAGTNAYVQALRAAAADGVDVRLLVPGATDIPLLKPLSRAGYRTLLDAGVRVFEWNGTMLHAKTAVADGRWARIGSSNLNVASWFGNCEMDVVVEDESFARLMERMYLEDLANATEVVLDSRRRIAASDRPRGHTRSELRRGGGSAGHAAAGAARIGNAVGAAFTGRRVLEPAEARVSAVAGAALATLAALFAFFPRVAAYPLAALLFWFAAALLYRAYRLYRPGGDRRATGFDTRGADERADSGGRDSEGDESTAR